MNQGVKVGGRRPLVEDDLWWKTTYVGRRPLVEDDLWWKTTFGGRHPLVEDDLWWKTTYGALESSKLDHDHCSHHNLYNLQLSMGDYIKEKRHVECQMTF